MRVGAHAVDAAALDAAMRAELGLGHAGASQIAARHQAHRPVARARPAGSRPRATSSRLLLHRASPTDRRRRRATPCARRRLRSAPARGTGRSGTRRRRAGRPRRRRGGVRRARGLARPLRCRACRARPSRPRPRRRHARPPSPCAPPTLPRSTPARRERPQQDQSRPMDPHRSPPAISLCARQRRRQASMQMPTAHHTVGKREVARAIAGTRPARRDRSSPSCGTLPSPLSAWPPCHRIASAKPRARPSCSRNRWPLIARHQAESPQRRRAPLAAGRQIVGAAVGEPGPMSCSRRSVNGRIVWFESSGQPSSVPVVIFATWQLAQPSRVEQRSPRSAAGSSRLRARRHRQRQARARPWRALRSAPGSAATATAAPRRTRSAPAGNSSSGRATR